jgi:hypothetical protein
MPRKLYSRFAFPVLLYVLAALPAFSDSHIRIVRLSYVEGEVQIDRNTGKYEKAIVNLPITEGVRLRTGGDARAEVEFEDGSTLRLASDTTLQFPHLSLQTSGTKVSSVALVSGTIYLDYPGAKNNEMSLEVGREKLALVRAAHLRVQAGDKGTTVAVFKGEVRVQAPSGEVEVKKNQSADFDGFDDKAQISRNIDEMPLDSWDKQQSQYHQRYSSNSYDNYSPYAYGTSDLAYYGSFFSAPGYGMMWQPYFIGAGWDPFMNGAWAYSPGFGFGWVSAYPWGWTPFHYGAWVFLPGYGWAWQPGGAWTPWYSQPVLRNAPAGFVAPHAPAAMAGGTSIVTVNRGPASTLAGKSTNKVVIRNNSAGLGVPRGEVANLRKVSQNVQQRGMATTHVHTAPASGPSFAGFPQGPRGGSGAPRNSAPPMSSTPRMSSPPPSTSGPSHHK